MPEEPFRCAHWSLANALDDEPSNLPKLLRRVADQIEKDGIASDDILDITISETIEHFGSWWHATVYWSDRPRLKVVD